MIAITTSSSIRVNPGRRGAVLPGSLGIRIVVWSSWGVKGAGHLESPRADRRSWRAGSVGERPGPVPGRSGGGRV